ncbi:hypothetical protein [Micromonospora sp. WMMC250]|uniref:hypothetical protein n=1 Tax=Micromonospora sp. WMMC250 TaxID=3014781 RepID=UPI0022B6120C|nr:hypothetical protein [Micromonospora sp. WMMC250]MCZ7379694.1 hypothetical protein [Micromonospora sp. WMMC250]MCZ7379945.1 hypothetical protein [Micromonospora sp. WMMC250]
MSPLLSWLRRAGAAAVAATVVSGLVMPGSAAAAPTPEPSASSAPCAAPASNGQLPRPGGLDESVPQVAWCLPWVQWQPGTGWVTVCSKATGAVDQERCDAVSATLETPPPDRTHSVLDDRLPTGGRQPVRCERFAERASEEPNNAARWTAKEKRCEALRASLLLHSSLRPAEDCPTLDVACRVGTQVKDAARSGFEGLADIAVAGFAWALSKLAEVVFEQSSAVADEPFYNTYNDISGVLIIMVLLVFILSTAINGMRLSGPGPLSSLGGLVRAMFGITFAGGLAFTLMAAWDEATIALIQRNQQRDWQPSMWVDALNTLTADTGTVLLAFVVAVISFVGLVLVFLMLLFRSLLAAGAALFGAMAMTGQVMAETRSWGRKWFWTCNALAASKFFIAALWIYGTRTTYESDNVVNVLRGMFIIILMVLAPWILLRLTSMWDGYLADVDARGFLTSAAGAVGMDAAARRLTESFSGGGSEGDATSLMQGNSDAIPTSPASGPGLSGVRAGAIPDAVGALEGRGGSGKVGEPVDEPGQGQGQGGDENWQEANGIEQDSRTAQGDMARGQLTTPGDAMGEQGSLPVTPGAMQEHLPGHGGGAGGGDPAGGAAPGGPGGAGPGTAPDADASGSGGQPNNSGTAGGEATGGSRAGGAAAGGAAEVPIIPV